MTDTPMIQPMLKPPRFRAARTIVALMLREMGSTYGATPGGYIWALLQPVGMVMILALAFSLLVRAPSLGTSFILFYATGFLPFSLFMDLERKIGNTLSYAHALLAYPSVTWADAILARFILNALTGTTVFSIIITGIMVFEETRTVLDVTPILLGLSMACLLGLGVGLWNAIFGGLFPLWIRAWQILSRPLFLASAIFFIYEDMPTLVQNILWWNPLVHVSGLIRSGFYPTYNPQYVSLAYGYGIALGMILIGLIFTRAYYAKALER